MATTVMSSSSLVTIVAHVLSEQSPGNALQPSIRNQAQKLLRQVFSICVKIQYALHSAAKRPATGKYIISVFKANCVLFAAPKANRTVRIHPDSNARVTGNGID